MTRSLDRQLVRQPHQTEQVRPDPALTRTWREGVVRLRKNARKTSVFGRFRCVISAESRLYWKAVCAFQIASLGGLVTFEVGDKVIYPNHGLGIVERIEDK